MAKQEPADDTCSESTAATATDKKVAVAVVRAKDRMTYEQWKEQEEAKKAGRMPVSKAIQVVESRNALSATVQVAKVSDVEVAEDINGTCGRQQVSQSGKTRKAKKGMRLQLSDSSAVCDDFPMLGACDSPRVAAQDTTVDGSNQDTESESISWSQVVGGLKVEEQKKEEPSEPSDHSTQDDLDEESISESQPGTQIEEQRQDSEEESFESSPDAEDIWEFVD